MPFISNGTTILDNGAFSVSLGSQVLIKEITASSDASISFVDGSSDVVLDSTYPIYKFEFINIHGANSQELVFDFSSDGGSTYDKVYTTTFFKATQNESDTDGALNYVTARDLANSGARPFLTQSIGTGNDESGSGEIFLYNPSSTTFVKHFLVTANMLAGDYTQNTFVGGYCNTTSAIDAIKFEMDSGNIDSGKIKLYGIKDS